jgi:hypothetical protein
MSGQLHDPAALPPVEETPLGPRAGMDDMENFLDLNRDSNSDPLVVQPVASRHTEYAIQTLSFLAAIYLTG